MFHANCVFPSSFAHTTAKSSSIAHAFAKSSNSSKNCFLSKSSVQRLDSKLIGLTSFYSRLFDLVVKTAPMRFLLSSQMIRVSWFLLLYDNSETGLIFSLNLVIAFSSSFSHIQSAFLQYRSERMTHSAKMS